MIEIQTACADLGRHRESYVARLGRLIAELDARRDLEHEKPRPSRDCSMIFEALVTCVSGLLNSNEKGRPGRGRPSFVQPSCSR